MQVTSSRPSSRVGSPTRQSRRYPSQGRTQSASVQPIRSPSRDQAATSDRPTEIHDQEAIEAALIVADLCECTLVPPHDSSKPSEQAARRRAALTIEHTMRLLAMGCDPRQVASLVEST